MRPVHGAPSEEWDRWLDDYNEDMQADEPKRDYPQPRPFDALDEEQARSPISRYMSGAGSIGVEMGEQKAPVFPVIQEAD